MNHAPFVTSQKWVCYTELKSDIWHGPSLELQFREVIYVIFEIKLLIWNSLRSNPKLLSDDVVLGIKKAIQVKQPLHEHFT